MKHTIWTSDLDYKDWKDDLESQYPSEEGFTEEDRIRIMYEINEEYLTDETITLDKELGNQVVAVAELGLWNGRRYGYKFVGTNLNNIFSYTCGESVEWLIDNDEIICNDSHHDGTNHYTYRLLKKDVSKFEFEEYVYDHSMDEALKELTEPIGHYVKEIYGLTTEEK